MLPAPLSPGPPELVSLLSSAMTGGEPFPIPRRSLSGSRNQCALSPGPAEGVASDGHVTRPQPGVRPNVSLACVYVRVNCLSLLAVWLRYEGERRGTPQLPRGHRERAELALGTGWGASSERQLTLWKHLEVQGLTCGSSTCSSVGDVAWLMGAESFSMAWRTSRSFCCCLKRDFVLANR